LRLFILDGRVRESVCVLMLAFILTLGFQLVLSSSYINQGSNVEIFAFNLNGFSVLVVHGYRVKDIRVVVGKFGEGPHYFFPIVEKRQNYTRGRLVIYHSNLKGESCLTVMASPLDNGMEIIEEIPIVYLRISATAQVNQNGTITIQGSVYAENHTIASSIISIVLPTGEIYSTQADWSGNFSVIVPYASSYTVRAHGGYAVGSDTPVIICSTLEMVKPIAP